MKKVILSSLLIPCLLLSNGCVTTPEGRKRPDPVVVTGSVKLAVEDATIVYLLKNPAAKPAFVKARAAASDLLIAGEGTTEDLKKILSELPIKDFQSNDKKVQLVIDHAIFVVDIAAKWTLGAPATDRWKYFVKPVATGIVQGLDVALAD